MTSDTEARIAALEAQIDQLMSKGGLRRLLTTDITSVPVRYITAAPTDTAPNGTIRVARISGADHIYIRSNGAWVAAT